MTARHDLLVTIEENVIAGGAGSGVNECLAAHGACHPVINYGLPDRLIQHGSRDDMLANAELTSEAILRFIQDCVHKDEKRRSVRSARVARFVR